MAANTAVVDDLTMERDRRRIEAMDDETLVFCMIGLLGEAKGQPDWGRTSNARYLTRVVFNEISRRWVPPAVFGAAFRNWDEDDDDDATAIRREQ